ncbi:MAG: DUF5336 domain-containing protein [Labilithrix sp.]|nr:DUF5336 domain-containing protein [Labilithrix sp.]MCW5813226.1 DUF5336 domain-containing protein [Labilithrix sp.]
MATLPRPVETAPVRDSGAAAVQAANASRTPSPTTFDCVKRRLPLVLLTFAVAALGFAVYLASFCVLLENECRLQHGAACVRLEQYFSAATIVAALALAAGLAAAATHVAAKRAGRRPSSRPS